jgi:hypothetical protein
MCQNELNRAQKYVTVQQVINLKYLDMCWNALEQVISPVDHIAVFMLSVLLKGRMIILLVKS